MLQRRTDWKKQILSVALALLMLLGSTPQPVLAAAGEILSVSAVPLGAAAGSSAENLFAGKTLSILGDSISTYTGVSNNKADNPTLAGGAIYYTAGRLGVYREDTWWQQTADQLGMNVLVNNSWSGSAMLNTRSGTVGAYLNRCVQLHNAEGEDPDIIAYYLGTNDFSEFLGGKCTLGTEDMNYAALISQSASGYVYATPTTVCEAYAIALHKTSVRYPDAEIYCLTPLVRTGQSAARIQYAKAFNEALQAIAVHFGAIPVNLYQDTGILDNRFFSTYVSDNSLHPGPLGMDAITGCLISAMLEHSRYSQAQTHSVTYTLNDMMVEQGTVCTVAAGEAFRCSLRAPAGYETTVTVTMGGKDVTADCYQNGKIHIPSVTGDIVITAASVKQATNYRWAFSDSTVTSVTEGDNHANALTKLGGSLTDGVLQSAYFQMAEQVALYHHRPWVVEWSAAGNWSGMLLSKQQTSTTAGNEYFFKSNSVSIGLIAFGQRQDGQYLNYGIQLADHGVDPAARHTYRLENRIAKDGSNAVHLLVDGVDYGAMTRHYIGTTDQNSNANWANGRDLTFGYIGTNGHALTGCDLDYLQIWEAGDAHTHTYQNGVCTVCGATASPYLQQLPENILGCTNLYSSLVPVKGYYTATKYDTSNGNVLSVVIPVEPGDRIASSSFGSISENMGSVDGIRVTYLLGDKIVTSLSADDVYNAYASNGYITVPDGVNAVCVPWWKPNDGNWLTLRQIDKDFAVHRPKTVSAQAPTCTESGYTAGEICEICNAVLCKREEIPSTGHIYSGDVCTVCGLINLETILGGKYVSILGDSISTFNGYSNDATVNTTIGGNGPRYDAGIADTKPGSYCLLESVDKTWWMHFANGSGMKLLVNNSWAGSQVFGGQTSDGRVIPAAYLDRCVNLHDNTLENNPGNAPINPDVIFVYLGINDYNFNRGKIGSGTVDYGSLVNNDGTYVTPTTFGEAYGIMLCKMREAYPDAQIFAMTLLPENLYSVDKNAWEQHNAYIRAAAKYYDIPVVDLAENCSITWENYSSYMIDKIHPTTAGMKLISKCIEAELAAYYTENLPHTHIYENGTCAFCGKDMLRIEKSDLVQYQGGVNSLNGTLNTTFTNNWYSDIRIPKGAQQVRYLTFKTGVDWGVAFLQNGTYLSGACDKTTGGQWVTADVPAGATVFRYGYLYDAIAAQKGLPAFAYVEFIGDELEQWEQSNYLPRPATGCHSFSVEVNIAPAQGNPDGYVKGTDYGYIQLPTNYSAYGAPTRLIIVCHGAGASLSTYKSSAWKNTNYSFWTDLGYAVMDMYASPQELTGSDSCLHYGNPVVLECYKKGYDYVMQHFNLKQDGIFLIGSSMGGLSSFQIAQSGQFPVIAQVAYCPVIDLFKQAYCNPWTTASYQRSRIASYFGFAGTAPAFTNNRYPSAQEIEFFRQNADKVTAYSPILRNVIDGDITALFNIIPTSPTATSAEEAALYAGLTATHPNPLLVFHNTDDGTVSYRYSQYFVEMVNRSGQEAVLRTFTSGNHNAWANGENKTVQGINGTITIKESQYEAYLFFDKFEQHESHCPWTDPAKIPTCNASGLTEGSHCAVCGEVLKKQEPVPAKGHSFTRYISDGNATFYADGTKTALCDHGCGAKDTVADVGSMLLPEQVTSQIYPITGEFLTGAPAGTTVQTLLSGLDWGTYCTVFDADGRAVAADAAVGTGMVLKLQPKGQMKQTLVIVVAGDLSGDGAVTETDLMRMQSHLLQVRLLTGAFAKAADCSGDGIVSVTDIIRLQALLLR